MKVRRILAAKSGGIISIRPEQTIREAITLLTKHNIGAVIVVVPGQERPVGIVSERDIIRRAATDEACFSDPVETIMTRELVTGMPQDDLYSVAHTMTERRFRHLPIMDEGRLVGIISIGDVLKAQRDAYRGEVDTREAQLLAGGEE
ncbi:MAG: CBS domain-containing protein [Anaerolineae bacterium]|nr:CBS domain-containing protein [Anaerolineae bacterium]